MWKRTLIISGAAIVLSTLGIQASDLAQNLDTSLLGLATESTGPCGAGAVVVLNGARALCVDQYEASASEACPHVEPANSAESSANISSTACLPASQAAVAPWRYVSQSEAAQLCARAGKRLPTNEEWFRFSSGLADVDACAIDSSAAQPTGVCSSPLDVYDSVGNVWEWLDEEVIDGTYRDRSLPASGYVARVDTKGIALETTTLPDEAYGFDYVAVDPNGVRGVIRGGFYGSQADAGIYSVNATVPLDLRTAGIGFRCVMDVRA